jgi:hypothetical protein
VYVLVQKNVLVGNFYGYRQERRTLLLPKVISRLSQGSAFSNPSPTWLCLLISLRFEILEIDMLHIIL